MSLTYPFPLLLCPFSKRVMFENPLLTGYWWLIPHCLVATTHHYSEHNLMFQHPQLLMLELVFVSRSTYTYYDYYNLFCCFSLIWISWLLTLWRYVVFIHVHIVLYNCCTGAVINGIIVGLPLFLADTCYFFFSICIMVPIVCCCFRYTWRGPSSTSVSIRTSFPFYPSTRTSSSST